MTIPSTARKAGPLLGNGATTAFPFTFKVFAASDLRVTIANSLGLETVLVLDTDYSVALNANQDTSPGGTVTYPISGTPLATGSVLAIVGDLDYDQPLDLPSGGNFSPLALENELDRVVMQIQQLEETNTRTLRVGVTTDADAELPAPVSNNLIGWNPTATGLQNVPLAELATAVAFATYRYDTFTGDGVTTTFVLDADPVTLGNLDVSVDGQTYVPGVDHNLVGTSLVFTVAPGNGAEILARYGQGLASGASGDALDISYQPAGTGAVTRTAQAKLRETMSVKDFGAVGDGVTDDTAAIQAAITQAKVLGGVSVYLPNGTYLVSANFELGMASYNNTAGAVSIVGENMAKTIVKPSLTGTTALFSFTGGNTNYYSFGQIRNITIDPGVFKSGNGCGVKIDCTIGNKISNVTINNMKYGVWLYAGTSFGGAGWVEYNEFDHVVTDYNDVCWLLEQAAGNTNPIPSHGYNKWTHCLGNVFLVDSTGGNKQTFFYVLPNVNFYNSDFDFYVNTQDGGILVYASGNGGGPLAGGREGLVPSNTGNFHVESNSGCNIYGTTNFWWSGLLSYTSSNFYDNAGISLTYPGQSVFQCDNYVYSGFNLNVSGSIDRFTDANLTPNYPLARAGKDAPYVAVEDSGLRKGMVVYADTNDSGAVFGLGLRSAGTKLQAIALNWWQLISGKVLGNKFNFRIYSDTISLTTTPTAIAALPVYAGSFTMYMRGVTDDWPTYVFSMSKPSPFSTPVINIVSGAPSTVGGHTVSLTWGSTSLSTTPVLSVSNAAIAGTYQVTLVGVTRG